MASTSKPDPLAHTSPKSKPKSKPKHASKLSPARITPPEQRPLSLQPLRVVGLPSLAFAGVQLAWAVQIGHATAHLRKLGLSDRMVGLAWLAGPVTGMMVQPVVGVLSDRCTHRLGRRRPFMLLGAVLVALMLLLFAFAGDVAALLGDPISVNGGGSRTALRVALAAFWVLDLGINVLQTPTRALLADLVPPEQLPAGNALFAVANGFGKAVGYAAGAFAADFRTVATVAAATVLLFALIPAALIRERAPTPAERAAPGALDERPGDRADVIGETRFVARETGAALRALPRGIRQVFAVQWFTYLSFMLLFIYLSDWVGLEVTGGDADAPPSSAAHARFTAGVMLANKGLLVMSVLSMLLSPLVPALARGAGTRALWGGSLAVMGFALVSALLRPGRGGALFIVVCVALPLSTAFTIPWAIASLALQGPLTQQRGLYLAIFNLSQATPGVVASCLGGLIVHLAQGRLAVVLAAAGLAALVAAAATMFVDVPRELVRDTEELAIKGKARGKKVARARCAGCFPSDAPAVGMKKSGSAERRGEGRERNAL